MHVYILRRLLATVPVLLGVSVLVFLMLHLTPGDPALLMMGAEGTSAASAEAVDHLRQELGLNDPIWVQYWRFLRGAVRGDLGRSIWSEAKVSDLIREQLPSTLRLSAASLTIAVLLGVSAGVLASLRPNSLLDNTSMFVALVGVSMPSFWLGLILIYLFSFRLGWLPATTDPNSFARLVLPALALGAGSAAIIARLTRAGMLDVLGENFVVTARAKGLRERAVILRHALRNATIPVVTIIGLQLGAMLSGAVVIETVFARQGIGRLAITAILGKDFPLVQGIVLVVALAYVITNLAVDLSYAFLDPRIRYQ
jgi:ABC-type dipeptide/oligopeptide/nickel transport system permease component